MQLTGSTRSLKSKKQCTWVLQCNTSASELRPFMWTLMFSVHLYWLFFTALHIFWVRVEITFIAVQCFIQVQQNSSFQSKESPGCTVMTSDTKKNRVSNYSWGLNKDELKPLLSLSGISFYFILASPLPSLHLFCSCQTRTRRGVGSTWARTSRLRPISHQLPAWYQSTLYSHPAEKQLTLKETEGDLVWWRYECVK